MRVVFFPVGGPRGPSSKYRCFLVEKHLKKHGIKTLIKKPFQPHPNDSKVKKVLYHVANTLKRCIDVINTEKDDIIFIHIGMADYGSPIPEFITKKILKRRMIFDYDDAIYLLSTQKLRLEPWRTNSKIGWSDIVLAGSHLLYDYALKFNDNVFLIPTSVDTELFKPIKTAKKDDGIIIGWVGGPSTIKYLKVLEKPLEALGKKYSIELRVYGVWLNKNEVPSFANIKLRIIEEWLEPEALSKEISKFDIGVMPLFDTEWEKGKCALKALEYMAMGIPAVCSAVGENNYVIENGVNGFLCRNEDEWVEALEKLIIDKELRERLGREGNKRVLERYSISVNAKRLAKILRRLDNGRTEDISTPDT